MGRITPLYILILCTAWVHATQPHTNSNTDVTTHTLIEDFHKLGTDMKTIATNTVSSWASWARDNLTWDNIHATFSPYTTRNTGIGVAATAMSLYAWNRCIWTPWWNRKIRDLADKLDGSYDNIGEIAWIDLEQLGWVGKNLVPGMLNNLTGSLPRANLTAVHVSREMYDDLCQARQWIVNNTKDLREARQNNNPKNNHTIVDELLRNIDKILNNAQIKLYKEDTLHPVRRGYTFSNRWLNTLSFGTLTWERLACIGCGVIGYYCLPEPQSKQ